MNLTIQLTDEQAKQLAEQIKATEHSPAQFQIEVGKRYIRRDGSISGEIESCPLGAKGHQFYDGKFHYMPDGHGFSDLKDNDIDLVREHVEAIPADKDTEPFVFDWSLVPDAYDYAGMEKDGAWRVFDKEPEHHNICAWHPVAGAKSEVLALPPFSGDWRESLQVRPKADKPERKAREWGLHRHKLNDFMRVIDGPAFPHGKGIRVREILPSEPTQRDIHALTDALWHAVERMKNLQSYQAGTAYVLPTVNYAIEYAEAALAPFRKP